MLQSIQLKNCESIRNFISLRSGERDVVERVPERAPHRAELETTVAKQEATAAKQEATVTELKSIVAKQEMTIAQQQKGLEGLVRLKEQDSQIKKVSAKLEVSKPVPQLVLNN